MNWTADALVHLEPKVSPGAWVVIDDYGVIEACRRAVHDYRDRLGIRSPLVAIDHSGVRWMKEG